MQELFRRFAACIESHGGIAHEIRGAALVAEFSRPSNAVAAASAYQVENLRLMGQYDDDLKPGLRILTRFCRI